MSPNGFSAICLARKGGVFGTWRAKVMGGTVEMRRNYALEPAEIEAGFGADVSVLSDRRHIHRRL
jgi:hypothetical protein